MSNSLAILVFLALHALDAITTILGLRAGVPEGNPIPASFLAAYGLAGMMGLKAFVALGSIVIVLLWGRRYPKLWKVLWVVSAFMVAVVVSNLLQGMA